MTVFPAGCKAEVLSAIEPCESSHWNELLGRAPVSDVYYRLGYVRASEAAGHGKAIGLILDVRDIQVFVPLLLLSLSGLPFAPGHSGFDAATPYGYGGLLPLSKTNGPEEADVQALLDALRQWCRDVGIVSCFIRLHPLLDQDRWLGQDSWHQQAASLHYRSSTVAVDLARWDDAGQRIAGLHKNRRVALNHARRSLRVSWGGTDIPLSESLALFRQIYEQRMTHLHASAHYFFPPEYYTSLAEGLGNNLAVALAWSDDRLVGASLFLRDHQFAHYHLSGSNDEGRRLEAGTLLINAGAQWAREGGCKLLHLGGGVGDLDGLFDYKRSFGGDVYRYHTLEVIADESRYRDLVAERLKCKLGAPLRQNFFPQYRG